MGRHRLWIVVALATSTAAGACKSAPPRPRGEVFYVGSSTVAGFLRDAEPVYGAIRFCIDTEPETEGGERAILEAGTDLAGIARRPSTAALRAGVVATLLGRDAIAVVVNTKNPITQISLSALRDVFTGKVSNWNEIGGPDLVVEPFIVGPGSATREVFRTAVLDGVQYSGCQEVQPDHEILSAVAGTPGGIGQISFSFLSGASGVHPLAVESEQPTVANFDYPISRPLFLLRREGNPVVEAFVDWTQTDEGQSVLMRRFVGRRVIGSVRGGVAVMRTGTLVVYTETYAYYDGGIYYYPHRPYEIRTREGELIRRVPNHRGENDEAPMRVQLRPGTYLIRTESSRGDRPEFFVTVESGRRVELDIVELTEPHR